jgi:hypothetical protein
MGHFRADLGHVLTQKMKNRPIFATEGMQRIASDAAKQ